MRLKALGGLFVVAAALGSASPVAGAQTGYPPGPCTVLVSSVVNVASIAVGATATITLTPTCTWANGARVTVLVNGVAVGVKVAGANGTVSIQVTVLSANQLSIDDPVLVPAQCGTNTVRGVGISSAASGNTVTHDATFEVVCPVAAVSAGSVSAGATRANSLSFTGYDVARAVAVALVVMMTGAVLVVAGRRRHAGTAAAA